MYLIFDTETSGFLVNSYPDDHPQQGRLMQLACLLLDENFKEINSFKSLVRLPDHTILHEGAFDAHKISKEDCNKFGVPVEAAIIILDGFLAKSQIQIAHNISFDTSILSFEDRLIFGQSRLIFPVPYCTMENSTDKLKLSFVGKKYNNSKKYKWSKLSEAYDYFYPNSRNGELHDALNDCRYTAKVYQALEKKLISQS